MLSAFVVHGEFDATVEDLRGKISSGDAAAFDALVCPLCRPYAWQSLLLNSDGPPRRYHRVAYDDLHHPFWLAPRDVLRFDVQFKGMVSVRSGAAASRGWVGLPRGLRASADRFEAAGFSILLVR